MNLFSAVLVLLFFVNLFSKKPPIYRLLNQTVVTIYVYLYVNVGYFLSSSVINIDYWQGALLLEFLLCVFLTREHKVTRQFSFYVMCLLISIVNLLVLPSKHAQVVGNSGAYQYYMVGAEAFSYPEFTKFTVFYFVLAIIQAYVFLVIKNRIKETGCVYLLSHLSALIKLSLIAWCAEFIVKNIMVSTMYNEFLTLFFGKGTSTLDELALRGNYYSLQGFTREPSQFAFALSYAVIVMYTEQLLNHEKKNTVWMGLILFLIATSGAFTALLSIVFLFALYTLYKVYINGKKGENTLKTICVFLFAIVAVVVLTFMLNYMSLRGGYVASRLDETMGVLSNLFNMNESYFRSFPALGSSIVRVFSVIHTLSNWMHRPLFGLGLATTFCHGSTALTLAEIGAVGFIAYLSFYFAFAFKNKTYKTVNTLVVLCWIVINLLSGCGTRYIIMVDGALLLLCFVIVEKKMGLNKEE